MLHFGAKKTQTALIEYQSISNLIFQKKFALAANKIEHLKDGTFAEKIIGDMLKKKSPECWLAFLRNRFLNHAIWSNHLIDMIQHAQKVICIGTGAFAIKPEYRQITLTIAQNPRWCKMLSYAFFLTYVEFDEVLKSYIVNSEQFIRNLEPYHVDVLVNKAPGYVSNIIISVAVHLQGNEVDILWAQETLKWLLNHNPHAATCLSDIAFDPLYEYIQSLYEDPQNNGAAPMDVDEPVYSAPMDLDEPRWGFPEELTAQDELEHLTSKLESMFYQPPAPQEQYLLLSPAPVRISQTLRLLVDNVDEKTIHSLQKSRPN